MRSRPKTLSLTCSRREGVDDEMNHFALVDKVKEEEPEVYLLACQLQINCAMTFSLCIDVARNILLDAANPGSPGFTFTRRKR